jgi:transglutaminase-like putative cysteine protease
MTVPTRPLLSAPLRLAGVLLLGVPGVVGFLAAFGTPWALVAGGAGLLLGVAVGWLSAARRLSAVSTAALTVLACVLFAGPAALPETTIAGVVPTLETLRQLASGVIRCWRNLITATAPTGALGDLLLVPFLTCLLAGVLAAVLALRGRRPGWALLPTGAVLVVSVLMGTAEAVSPLLEGALFVVLAVLWVALTATAFARPSASRAAAGIVLLAVAGTVAGVLGPAVTGWGADRFVLRDAVEPPFDIRDYPSPLNGYRKYVKEQKDATLFTVAGAPEGSRIRLATMDYFDGTVWNVAGGVGGQAGSSGEFRRLPLDTVDDPADVTVDVRVQDYTGVWLPDTGDVRSVDFTGPRADQLADGLRYNDETGTGIVPTRLRAGDGYRLRADVVPEPSGDRLNGLDAAILTQPEPLDVPEVITSVAGDAAQDAQSAWQRANGIADTLTTEGYFSDGTEGEAASRAGHGAGRLSEFLGSTIWIGDQEQYAAAAALMARRLGLPARVVMGFEVPGGDGPVAIHGSDVTAWIEVAFEDAGWVRLDVTPDENKTPPDQTPQPAPKPKPATQQPPPPVEQPPPPLPATGNDRGDQQESDSALPGWLATALTVAAWVGGPLLLILLICGLIIGLKVRRRRRRRRSGSTDQRVTAGWWEVLDAHRDHGAEIPRSGTRREVARTLGRPGTHELADRADAAVFAGGTVTEDDAATFWQLVDRELADLSSGRARDRWRARLSLRSLRRRTP